MRVTRKEVRAYPNNRAYPVLPEDLVTSNFLRGGSRKFRRGGEEGGGGTEKTAYISRGHHWFHREMTSEKRAHTLDVGSASD